jgi:hypothetical protein
MKGLVNNYKIHFSHKGFLASVFVAIVIFSLSLTINSYATSYATAKASNPVSDIVLDNIPVFDVDGIFFFGPLILIAFICLLAFSQPRRLPFMLKSIAIFVVVRSVFTILTHIAPSPEAITAGPLLLEYTGGFLEKIMFGGDLFFSGHTGLPFLMALIFWDKKWLRILFIGLAVFFGTIVLMAHIHYTIDVVAAFFITDGVFRLTEILFRKDRTVFKTGLGDNAVKI